MLAEILAADGHMVEEADSGRQALERLDQARFDLVISDPPMQREIQQVLAS